MYAIAQAIVWYQSHLLPNISYIKYEVHKYRYARL